jgi:protocatechuate 3,4-dioxygenase beta subunit
VGGATVEVWQVQPSGRYDVEDAPSKRNLRGRLRTDSVGAYRFATVRPVDYTVPEDGPVGLMLRAAGRHAWRPAHVHFRITAHGYEPLVTHVFDRTSPYLDTDAVFAVHPSLVADLDQGECTFDLVLQAAGD